MIIIETVNGSKNVNEEVNYKLENEDEKEEMKKKKKNTTLV